MFLNFVLSSAIATYTGVKLNKVKLLKLYGNCFIQEPTLYISFFSFVLTSFFWTQLTSFLSTTCWRDCLFSIINFSLFVKDRSDQISPSVVSDSLRCHESQHARPPCPSPTPGVHSDSSPSSQWCHPAISSTVIPFSSCPQSLPASESFPMSQLFAWGGQSTGVSALASFLPK